MVAFLNVHYWGRHVPEQSQKREGKQDYGTSRAGQLELPWNHIASVHQKPAQSCAKNIQCVTNTHSSLTRKFPYTSKP